MSPTMNLPGNMPGSEYGHSIRYVGTNLQFTDAAFGCVRGPGDRGCPAGAGRVVLAGPACGSER